MKRLLIAAHLALAFSSANAQEGPTPSAPVGSQQEARSRHLAKVDSDAVNHGTRRYQMKERGKHPGDPPVIDHSMDTLVVEPTRSSITVITPTPP
jgi:hypothetical protein